MYESALQEEIWTCPAIISVPDNSRYILFCPIQSIGSSASLCKSIASDWRGQLRTKDKCVYSLFGARFLLPLILNVWEKLWHQYRYLCNDVCTNVATGYLNFPSGINKVSIYLITLMYFMPALQLCMGKLWHPHRQDSVDLVSDWKPVNWIGTTFCTHASKCW